MPAIERRELSLSEPFNDREYGGVDGADVGVAVLGSQLQDAFDVVVEDLFHG